MLILNEVIEFSVSFTLMEEIKQKMSPSNAYNLIFYADGIIIGNIQESKIQVIW